MKIHEWHLNLKTGEFDFIENETWTDNPGLFGATKLTYEQPGGEFKYELIDDTGMLIDEFYCDKEKLF